jgi:hypothetical protein
MVELCSTSEHVSMALCRIKRDRPVAYASGPQLPGKPYGISIVRSRLGAFVLACDTIPLLLVVLFVSLYQTMILQCVPLAGSP